MAIMQVKVDNEMVKRLGLEGLLTDEKLIKVIDSDNRDDLRDLILDVAQALSNNSIHLENFYYEKYIALSDELFDMFSSSCLEEIFNLFGYKTELIEDTRFNSCTWIGDMRVYNENIEIYMLAEETMHDSYISIFINTKCAKYIKK